MKIQNRHGEGKNEIEMFSLAFEGGNEILETIEIWLINSLMKKKLFYLIL